MIIDTHQHFWRVGEPTEKSPEDYKILVTPRGVTGVILRWMETRKCLDLAAAEPLIVGVCGGPIKSGPGFENELREYAADPMYRGFCYRGTDLENIDERFIDDMRRLADRDLQLDLLRVCPGFVGGPRFMQDTYGTGSSQILDNVLRIANEVPHLRMVVEHIGGMPIDGKPVSEFWKSVFHRLAERPNIYMKVSGLMERTQRAPGEKATDLPSYYRPALQALWEIFGEDRLFYGSNWPVCEHVGDYITHGLEILTPFFAEKGSVATEKFFWRNSQTAYKWVARLPSQK
jgi:L-fuconolactonase